MPMVAHRMVNINGANDGPRLMANGGPLTVMVQAYV